MTLDPQLTFGPHAKAQVDKMGSRMNVMKAVAGTDWGGAQEDLELTYKAIGASMTTYAAPVYEPNLKPSHVQKLQRMQNQCLRVVTGAHAACSQEHLHHETKVLPIADHLQLLNRQFLAAALTTTH